jgi:hypothetical protein
MNDVDLQLSMHWSKGDVPRCTCYRSMTRFNMGEIKAQITPSQLNLLMTCVTNIMTQVHHDSSSICHCCCCMYVFIVEM